MNLVDIVKNQMLVIMKFDKKENLETIFSKIMRNAEEGNSSSHGLKHKNLNLKESDLKLVTVRAIRVENDQKGCYYRECKERKTRK